MRIEDFEFGGGYSWSRYWVVSAASVRASFVFVVLVLSAVLARSAEFAVYDLYIDSGENALAAYQVKIQDKNAAIKVISVEGGTHPAFREPPFFDPKAIQKNVIKLAAFRLEPTEKLPQGKTHVASLHVALETGAQPNLVVVVEAAAGPSGRKLRVEASISKNETK
jgi:hypothetical protein